MPLLSLWHSNPAAVAEFTIEQVVATAGDGNLKDGSICSQELQNYLGQVSSEKLSEYVDQCLSGRFDKSGIVLQDLVNELGRRLDYRVTNGRYQGTTNAIGFDGIWVAPEGHTIVAEVKTTDAYRISLDTIVGYRQKLLFEGIVNGEPSILVVVGRQDTGELEAQVRGSRHAWDIRLISAESLIKLVKLKENSDELETGGKIRSVLMPVEYTRLDRLVDVMFTAATDVEPAIAGGDAETPANVDTAVAKSATGGTWEFTDSALLQQKRDQIIKAASGRLGTALIKKLAHCIGVLITNIVSRARSRNATPRGRPIPIGTPIIRSGTSFWIRARKAISLLVAWTYRLRSQFPEPKLLVYWTI